MIKTCAKCGEEKPLTEFSLGTHPNGKKQYHSYCKPCLSIYRKEYNRLNRERLRTYDREIYYPRRGRKYRRDRNASNRESTRTYANKYRKENPNRRRVWEQTRRALEFGALTTLTYEEWLEILKQHDQRCHYCGSEDTITMDHIIPLSKGGSHTKENVVPACKSCNSSKGVNRVPNAA